jgi:type II secretory pathway component GspD/PulD (secretin)
VPLLGDIPGLGRLFRHSDKTELKKNLMIFVTPTIVKDSDYQPTVSTFLSSKPEELPDQNFSSPWNNATPKDWSKKSGAASN